MGTPGSVGYNQDIFHPTLRRTLSQLSGLREQLHPPLFFFYTHTIHQNHLLQLSTFVVANLILVWLLCHSRSVVVGGTLGRFFLQYMHCIGSFCLISLIKRSWGGWRFQTVATFGRSIQRALVVAVPVCHPWNVLEFHLELQPVVSLSTPSHYLQIIHSFELA